MTDDRWKGSGELVTPELLNATLEAMQEAGEQITPEVLEEMADDLLRDSLKSKKRNKSRTEEYPILSDRQYERRLEKEKCFSSLTSKEKLAVGLDGFTRVEK